MNMEKIIDLARIVAILLIWFLFSRILINKLIERLRARLVNKQLYENLLFGVQLILKLIVAAISSVILFNLVFNIELGNLITSLSIIGAAISLSFKDSLTDIVEGSVGILSGQYKIGDNIAIRTISGGELSGKIKDLSLRRILLESEAGKISCRHSKIETIMRLPKDRVIVKLKLVKGTKVEEVEVFLGRYDREKLHVSYIYDTKEQQSVSLLEFSGEKSYVRKKLLALSKITLEKAEEEE